MINNTNATTPAVRSPPQMPPFDKVRRSLMHLPRMLGMVEEHGFQEHGYDRDSLRDYLANWNRLFGTIPKSKALEVPSDRRTVSEKTWADVTIKWDDRSNQTILHNDMGQLDRAAAN